MPRTVMEEIAYTRGLIAGRQRLGGLHRDREQQVHDARLGGAQVVVEFKSEGAHRVVHSVQVSVSGGCEVHAHNVEGAQGNGER